MSETQSKFKNDLRVNIAVLQAVKPKIDKLNYVVTFVLSLKEDIVET